MPTTPLRPFCPLCNQDFALEAFSDHQDFPKHQQALAREIVQQGHTLTRIADLLQQLLDKEASTP